MRARLPALLTLAAVFGAGPGLGQPAPSCPASVALVRSTLAEQGLDAAIEVYKTRVLADCPGPEQAGVARALALRHLPAIADAQAAGVPPAALLELLRRGLALDRTAWQLREVEGDLIQAAATPATPADFAAAFTAYQAALLGMSNLRPGQTPPRSDEVDRVGRKMEQAGLLSERPIPDMPGPAGSATETARSFTVTRIAQPIYFRENTASFTDLGRQAAAEVLAMLRSRGFPQVRVIGHTDIRGSVAANDRLSLARARAVVRFLEQNGYPPNRARAEGRGSRDPYQPVPITGVTFTQAQRWQMDRRVEVVIMP